MLGSVCKKPPQKWPNSRAPSGQRIARATEGIEIPWWFAGSEQFHQEEETPPFSFFWPKKVFLFFS